MNKFSFIFLLLLMGISTGYAQNNKGFFIGLGGSNTSFQDTKYSDVQYSGIGGAFELGFKKSNSQIIREIALTGIISTENAATHKSGETSVYYPKIHFKYLRAISDKLFIGGHWDVMDFYIRNTSTLGNNSTYYIAGSHLFASGIYKLPIGNKNKTLQIGLDIGLLSYLKESTSFSFSAPQNGLEDGEFNYQNEALENPFGFKYYVARPLWDFFNIRTHIQLPLNDKLSISYQWNLRRFAEVNSYPVTSGLHTFVLRYNFSKQSSSSPINK